MSTVLNSLDAVATDYTVFEQDQVLTAGQLNGVAAYLDDQARLTRVRLLGVGIACGLRATVSGSTVVLSRGVGVTTDGDLLSLDQDTVFDSFKAYDGSYPAYGPLHTGANPPALVPAWELVRQGANDPRATPLSGFGAAAGGRALTATTAVLLMESSEVDPDLCSGTDCDNLGKKSVHTPRLLVVDRPSAAALVEKAGRPGGAYAALPEVVADRPAIPATLSSPAALAAAYRAACGNTRAALAAAFPTLWPACSGFLAGAFAGDPAPAWVGRLAALNAQFAATDAGIQYYYGFLKDLADAWNEFREQLFGDSTWCAPPVNAFAKHLVLGDLTPGADPVPNRTGFYPSPLVGRAAGEAARAAFLLRRIDAMLARFQVSTAANQPIRVTPSAWEDRPLDERAIPIYYAPGGNDPIHRRWSWRLAARGQQDAAASYHQASWSGRAPLGGQIGRSGFFRVEGHLGAPAATALKAIDDEIAAHNLPFTVRAVQLGADRARIVRRPGPRRFTDLHMMHKVVRTDLSHRLGEVQRFNARFRDQVVDELTSGRVEDEGVEVEGVPMARYARDKSTEVAASAATARARMSRTYAEYRQEPASWHNEMRSTLQATGEFKYHMSPVVKTDFNTPFDSLIGTSHTYWLPWLDQILDWRDQKEDQKLLFGTFAREHAGLEHFGGVARGGTLVLVHAPDGTVVADFALPYHWAEEPSDADEGPRLTRPFLRPPFVVDKGVKVVPSRTTFFRKEWETRKPEIVDPLVSKWDEYTKVIDVRTAAQDRVFESYRDSYDKVLAGSLDVIKVSTSAGFAYNPAGAATYAAPDVTQAADPFLQILVEESRLATQKLDLLKQQAASLGERAEDRTLTQQIAETEVQLSDSIQRTASYMDKAGAQVSGVGTVGYAAVQQMGAGMQRLAGTEHLGAVQTHLSGIAGSTTSKSFGMALNLIAK